MGKFHAFPTVMFNGKTHSELRISSFIQSVRKTHATTAGYERMIKKRGVVNYCLEKFENRER